LAGIFFASVSIIIAEITLWIAISFGKWSQMSIRIVDYHLQTVKIDLNYTLL
jgi:hypothetical protein